MTQYDLFHLSHLVHLIWITLPFPERVFLFVMSSRLAFWLAASDVTTSMIHSSFPV